MWNNMKKIFIGVMCLALVACGAVGIKLSADAISTLADNVLAITGYMVAKNNVKHIPEIEKWYSVFQLLNDVEAVQKEWQHGQELLAKMVSEDPFIQQRIAKSMGMFELDYQGPKLPDEIERYKSVVDSFMEGVLFVKVTV